MLHMEEASEYGRTSFVTHIMPQAKYIRGRYTAFIPFVAWTMQCRQVRP